MENEILNIDYHVKILVLKALNKYNKLSLAYKALGCSEKHLWKLRKKYRIEKSKLTGKYLIPEVQKRIYKPVA